MALCVPSLSTKVLCSSPPLLPLQEQASVSQPSRSHPHREPHFSEGLSAHGDFTSSPTTPCPAPAV